MTLAGLSSLAALGALEIALRLVGPPPDPPEDTLRTFTEYDPALGWKGRPGAAGLYRSRRFSVPVTLNRGGWRDDEETAGDAEGARSIALLGDSFAWGFGVRRGEMFADRIEVLLPRWRVFNYGVAGYGTDQELLVFRRDAAKRRSQIVVLEFAVENDLYNILDTISYGLPKPRFVLEGSRLRLEGVPVPRLSGWEAASRGSALKEFGSRHLRLYAWARPRWGALRQRLARATGLGGDDVVAMRRVRLLAREPRARLEKGWRLAGSLLEALREAAAAAGGRLVVLEVPDRLQVDDALWDEAVAVFRLDRAGYDRDLPETQLARICGQLGVPLVRTLPELRARMRAGVSPYITDDIHWNALGNEVAARELERALRPMVEELERPAELR